MKKALGKGLSSLIPDNYTREKDLTKEATPTQSPGQTTLKATPAPVEAPAAVGFQLIALSDITPNKEQPRTEFNPEAIEELADSIKSKGVLQPIVVSQRGEGKYDLICGERRFRAATLCGLTKIPAVIKDIAKEDFLEWALIENIQREDLNAIEEASAYQKLCEASGMGHEEIAKRVSKDRSTVANMLRLLRLPESVQQWLAEGRLTAGHGRALLGLLTPEHQRQMAKRIVEENLSVRQVEAIVGRSNAHKRKPKKARHLTAEIVDLERRMEQHLGTHVRIFPKKSKDQGRIEIRYFSLDDMDRILQKINLPEA